MVSLAMQPIKEPVASRKNLNSLPATSVCPLGLLSLRSPQITKILASCPKIAEPMELFLVKEIGRVWIAFLWVS